MASIKELIKDGAVGAFVPGSIAYSCTKSSVEGKKSTDIEFGARRTDKNTIDDKVYGAITGSFVGVLDLAMYSFYDIAFAAATGKDILGFGSVFLDNPNYVSAVTFGLAIGLSRAVLNIHYKKSFRDEQKKIEELLERKHPYLKK